MHQFVRRALFALGTLAILTVNLLVDPEWGDSSKKRPLVTFAEKQEAERRQSIHFRTIRDFGEQVGKCRPGA